MASVTRYLQDKLKLAVNQEKSKIVGSDDCEYLGFTVKGTRIIWSERSLADFKPHVKTLTRRSWGISMRRRMEELSRYLRGWMGDYALSEYYRPVPELDEWLRRRVRMCYIKQWPKPRTRISQLLKLGVPQDRASSLGMSSKGWWKLSRTYATQLGMNNAWLARQGLLSIKELWCAYHYPQ